MMEAIEARNNSNKSTDFIINEILQEFNKPIEETNNNFMQAMIIINQSIEETNNRFNKAVKVTNQLIADANSSVIESIEETKHVMDSVTVEATSLSKYADETVEQISNTQSLLGK